MFKPRLSFLLFAILFISNYVCAQSRLLPFSDGRKWGLTNEKNELVRDADLDSVHIILNNQYAQVEINGKEGILNRRNEALIPISYQRAMLLDTHLAIIRQEGKFFFQDLRQHFRESERIKFEDWSPYMHNSPLHIIRASLKGLLPQKAKTVFYNPHTNKILGGQEFDDGDFVYDHQNDDPGFYLATVKRNDKTGVLNLKTGKLILPIIYKNFHYGPVNYGDPSTYYAYDGKKFHYFLRKGELLVETPLKKRSKTNPDPIDDRVMVGNPEDQYYTYKVYYDSSRSSWIMEEKSSIENQPPRLVRVKTSYPLDSCRKLLSGTHINQVRIKTKSAGLYGIVDFEGRELLPPVYQKIDDEYWLSVRLYQNQRTGIYALGAEKMILPCVATKIRPSDLTPYYTDYLATLENGLSFIVDLKNVKYYLPEKYRALIK